MRGTASIGRSGRILVVMTMANSKRPASGVYFESTQLAAGKVAPSPMPSTQRTANSDTSPVTAAVAIVVNDHTSPQTVSVRRTPNRSANQLKRRIGIVERRERDAERNVAQTQIRVHHSAAAARLTRSTKRTKCIRTRGRENSR
jgi:hypothetical protein